MAPKYVPTPKVTYSGPADLGVSNEIVSSDGVADFYTLGQASAQFFLYLNPLKRTGTYTSCGTNPNQPSCSDGTTGPCKCAEDTVDCSMCASNGYINIVNIAGVVALEILPVPDAGRQGSSMLQLTVKTETAPLKGSTSKLSQKYIETLVLPPIPYQQWVMITIAREGRRFDISYNKTLVLSQITMNMPVTSKSSTNGKGLTSGGVGLMGTLTALTMYKSRQSAADIDKQYGKLADTRGKPYGLPSIEGQSTMGQTIGIVPMNSMPSFPTASWCVFGACLDEPTIQPANPMYNWATSYA